MNAAALHMAPEPRSATPSARIDDETPVVPGVPDISVFGDWIWVLARADHHDGRAASQCTIDWMELLVAHPAWVPTLKELCWHRLNTRLGLRWINEMLKMCAAAGLTREQTVRMFRTFGYYLNGAILDETAGYARGPSTVEPVPDDEVARDYPEVIAAGPYFRESEWDKTFDFGVELLIEGYARLAKENKRDRA